LLECRYAGLTLWVVRGSIHEHTDAPYPFRLLCVRHRRPYDRAAKPTDECAPPHRCALTVYRNDLPFSLEGVDDRGYVRFGSKADMCSAKRHVRFTPKSGHVQCNQGCPLWANSGHGKTGKFVARVRYFEHRRTG